MFGKKEKKINRLTLIKKELGNFSRIFIFLLLITLIIINWGTVEMIFDYKAVYSDFFFSIKNKIVRELEKGNEITLKVPEVRLSEPEFEPSDKVDSIEIPEIEIEAPLIFPESNDKNILSSALKQGVVFYPDSVLPGQEGMTVVLGHSAPSNWPKVNYDWVFTHINELKEGDQVFIHFDHKKYPYFVTKTYFLNKGEEIPDIEELEAKSVLMILSCWPPGVDHKRIAVQAELEL